MDQTVDQVVQNVVTLVSTWGLRMAGALAVLILGRFACGAARKSVRRAMESRRVDASLVPFVSNLVYFVLLAAVVIAVLGLFGIETTSLVAVLGTAGLAIGLAVQGTLANFSSGVMLLLFRPFRIGDYIESAGVSGTVAEIGVFSTILNTPDNVKIIVPNSGIYGATIKNYSANDTRRNDIVLGISYDDDISNAISVVNGVLSKDSRVLKEPESMVAVSELADSSVNLVVRPWCHREDYWNLRFDLIQRFKQELEQAGCTIPYPQRDVHLHQVNGFAEKASPSQVA